MPGNGREHERSRSEPCSLRDRSRAVVGPFTRRRRAACHMGALTVSAAGGAVMSTGSPYLLIVMSALTPDRSKVTLRSWFFSSSQAVYVMVLGSCVFGVGRQLGLHGLGVQGQVVLPRLVAVDGVLADVLDVRHGRAELVVHLRRVGLVERLRQLLAERRAAVDDGPLARRRGPGSPSCRPSCRRGSCRPSSTSPCPSTSSWPGCSRRPSCRRRWRSSGRRHPSSIVTCAVVAFLPAGLHGGDERRLVLVGLPGGAARRSSRRPSWPASGRAAGAGLSPLAAGGDAENGRKDDDCCRDAAGVPFHVC